MLIAGAGGHAIEILQVITSNNYRGEIVFFDDVRKLDKNTLFGKYTIISKSQDAIRYFKKNPDFCIGIWES